MKKSLWIGLSLLFIAGCSFQAESEKEEKFVNPLFYKQLSPLSSNSCFINNYLLYRLIRVKHF